MSIDTVSNNIGSRTNMNAGLIESSGTQRIKDIPGGRKSEVDGNMKFSEERLVSEDDIIDAIERANEEFVVYDRRFEFSIHEKTRQIMVKVIDTTNDDVIRELPPEKILDMVAALWEVAGIMVDEKI